MEGGLELRMEVLKFALYLEDTVTDLIKSYFFIEKDKLKALSHKSGNLSFKNKIDLLSDFEILSEQENDALNKLMEFRNQFMHNSHCNTFVDAVKLLGNDRGRFLCSFLQEGENNLPLEEQYLLGYRSCFLQMSTALLEKIQAKINFIEEKADIFKSYTEKIITLIDYQRDMLLRLMENIVTSLIQDKVDIKSINSVITIFTDEMELLKSSGVLSEFKYKITVEKAIQLLKR